MEDEDDEEFVKKVEQQVLYNSTTN